MSEADHILKELLRMLDWIERLEGEKAYSNYIIAEDVGAQNVGVLTIFLGSFVDTWATRHQLHDVQNMIEELQGCMELLVGDFVNLNLCGILLYTATVQRAMQEVEGAEHERDANMTNVNLEVHLWHLGFGLVARQQFVLFFHSIIGLLLSLLMLSFSPDTDSLEHKTLHFEHMKRVVFFDCDFVLSDVFK